MFFLKVIQPISKATEPDITSVNRRIDSFNTINKSILQKNDSLIHVINKLNTQVDYKQSLLEDFDKLSTNYSIFIGALIGLFALFGVLAYLIGYRPLEKTKEEAIKLLDDMKNNMAALFNTYIHQNKIELMDKAISNFEHDKTSEIINSYLYIEMHMNEGFTDSQILRILKLIKKKHKQRDILLQTLIYTDNIFIEDFYSECLKNKTSTAGSSLLYFAKYNKVEYIDDIINFIIESNNLIGNLGTIANQSSSFANLLINNMRFVNGINERTLYEYVGYMIAHHNDVSISIDLENSKLYEKYKQLNIYLFESGLNHSDLPRKELS